MQLHVLVAMMLGAVATTANAIPVNFYNRCATSISLYNNTYTETINPGSSITRNLEQGFSGMFRNGWNPQATLAEFSVSWGFLWYDISIIPTGPLGGPGNCLSLDNCKQVTGGVGFNTPIQIAPSGCKTITCLTDGCEDAYQYPTDDWKTNACPDTTPKVDVTFCPGDSATVSAPVPAQSPTTTTLSTPAPTKANCRRRCTASLRS
ncbi:Carbohydrate-binding protein [Phytophthora palmivora]|uniref:Carbohydrate-binding protein n=1 Tax=Phytophthora palmivora TaxID=4796 RepID=A0A2P4XST8_9STRA|nr:Carbohydrate-binding protein [Phytophthora palmivora]